MSYRSNIRIITSKKGFDRLKEYVDTYLEEKGRGKDYNLLDNLTIKKENDYEVYFGWDWLKWYEGSYDDVDAIMKGLELLSEHDYSYRFARIGESYDDYEEQSFDSDNDEDEQAIDYPSMERYFDDEIIG